MRRAHHCVARSWQPLVGLSAANAHSREEESRTTLCVYRLPARGPAVTENRHTALRREIEAHLVQNPDDHAAHAAYADLLSESPSPYYVPCCDFITLQLAQEDEARS